MRRAACVPAASTDRFFLKPQTKSAAAKEFEAADEVAIACD